MFYLASHYVSIALMKYRWAHYIFTVCHCQSSSSVVGNYAPSTSWVDVIHPLSFRLPLIAFALHRTLTYRYRVQAGKLPHTSRCVLCFKFNNATLATVLFQCLIYSAMIHWLVQCSLNDIVSSLCFPLQHHISNISIPFMVRGMWRVGQRRYVNYCTCCESTTLLSRRPVFCNAIVIVLFYSAKHCCCWASKTSVRR